LILQGAKLVKTIVPFENRLDFFLPLFVRSAVTAAFAVVARRPVARHIVWNFMM
jgi:hypothetical protein